MKVLLLGAFIALNVCAALSQGVVDFRNSGITFTTPADRRVYGSGSQPLVGINWVAALYYQSGTPTPNWQDFSLAYGLNGLALARFRAPSTLAPGTWVNSAEVGNLRTLEGIGSGETSTLQVRVWDGDRFLDFNSAVAGGGVYWVSASFLYTVPQPNSPATAYYMENFRGAIPEPRTIVIGLIGSNFVLLTQRKAKRKGGVANLFAQSARDAGKAD